MFEVDELRPSRTRHFGLIVRDEAQLEEVREKLTNKYGISLIPPFRCDFIDPFGNRVQVVDLHDESLVWLLPYQEVQRSSRRNVLGPKAEPHQPAGNARKKRKHANQPRQPAQQRRTPVVRGRDR